MGKPQKKQSEKKGLVAAKKDDEKMEIDAPKVPEQAKQKKRKVKVEDAAVKKEGAAKKESAVKKEGAAKKAGGAPAVPPQKQKPAKKRKERDDEETAEPPKKKQKYEPPQFYKLFLHDCPDGIEADGVKKYYVKTHGFAEDSIKSVDWMKNGSGKFLGAGVVTFKDEATFAKAAALPGPTVGGKKVEVRHGAIRDYQSQIELWNLHPSTTEKDIRKHYSKAKGFDRLKWMTNKDGQFTGKAVVSFDSREAATAALKLGFPRVSGQPSSGEIRANRYQRVVHLKGSKALNDANVLQHYGKLGENAVTFIKWSHQNGKPETPKSFTGRGFISFKTPELAAKAVQEKTWMLDKEKIFVTPIKGILGSNPAIFDKRCLNAFMDAEAAMAQAK
jgi:hypothetical protein|mmetsp:Transcript_47813/g.80317  ORF Transcript_47813/g.80317 Transcript_47813/m.80317 type:complete len:388 (-) Transcript_47813:898-2061(-)